MACDAALMEQERFVSQLLQKRDIPFTLNVTDPNKPTLNLIALQMVKPMNLSGK